MYQCWAILTIEVRTIPILGMAFTLTTITNHNFIILALKPTPLAISCFLFFIYKMIFTCEHFKGLG
jgi:hypothetical protein